MVLGGGFGGCMKGGPHDGFSALLGDPREPPRPFPGCGHGEGKLQLVKGKLLCVQEEERARA